MAKGALYAEVEVAEGSKIHVFNTHLQSFYSLGHVEAHRVELLACLRLCVKFLIVVRLGLIPWFWCARYSGCNCTN